MGTKTKKAKTRLDAYYRLAKDQGYRARSAFKLIQLNRKYDFLAKSRVLVDLCAAPGGWLQVAAKYMPVGSKIVGVDLVPIAPIRGCKTFVGDITDDKTRKIILTWLKKEPVDCVIHDGAPNVGGVWSRDLFEQNALVLSAAKMAASMLKLGGYFVTKVFRSQDFHKLLWVLKQLFEKVEATKPLASRMESAEIFVVCAGYKAPKHIDPAMFNAQKVFSDVGEERILTPSGALVVPKSNVPAGYNEFATVSHRVASFTDFLRAEDPKAFLASHHELRFASDEDKAWLRSKNSKKELVYLCGDLQQVGRGDQRRLLRWREQLLLEEARRQATAGRGERNGSGNADDDEGELSGVDSDAAAAGDRSDEELEFDFDSPEGITRIAQELLEIRKKKSKELKKKQKKLVDRKLKQIKGLINYDPTGNEDQAVEVDDFRAAPITRDAFNAEGEEGEGEREGEWGDGFTVERLADLAEAELAGVMDAAAVAPVEIGNDPLNPITSVDLAAQEDWDLGENESANDDGAAKAGVASNQLVEGEEYYMDVDNYGNYLPAKRSARVRLFEPDDLDEADVEDGGDGDGKRGPAATTAPPVAVGRNDAKWQQYHRSLDKVLNETFPQGRGDPGSAGPARAKRRRAGEEERIDLTASAEMGRPAAAPPNRFTRAAVDESSSTASADDDDRAFSDLSELEVEAFEVKEGRVESRRRRALVPGWSQLTTQELVREQRKATLLDNRALREQRKRQTKHATAGKGKAAADGAFEEVPIAMTDPAIRARTLAIAQKMLDPRARREILDASINRYVFNDDDDLPDWFVKDEQRNCKITLPITAEEIEQQRQRFRELNARPSRKVMEAMGRKRRKAQRMLHKLVEKGKEDPRAREKASGLSLRKLMRSRMVKGAPKKASKYMDSMSYGQLRREKQRAKREKGKKRR